MEQESEVYVEERLGVEALVVAIINLYGDGDNDYDEIVCAPDKFLIYLKPKRLEFYIKNRDNPPAKLYAGKPKKFELKGLPSHL